MKYDIVSKRLLEIGKESILREIIGVQLDEAKLIELPQELLSLNRVDSPLLVEVKDKEDYIILLEWQSNWNADKVQDILGYRSRLKKKYHKPVKSVMVLFQPNNRAISHYKDEELSFHFTLIRMWKLLASHFAEKEIPELWPFLPLMEGGLSYVNKIEKKIYNSSINRSIRADLLTSLSIFTSMKDKLLASELLKKRRDIMIESPIYDLIKQEGLKEGREEGQITGKSTMLKQLYTEGLLDEQEYQKKMHPLENKLKSLLNHDLEK
ncbi:MAG TPA: hypothetical protein ENI73_06730 [Spirochaetes bacterium]|nr:hypothetical protein [Spirochaetota bacterium]